MNWRIFFKFIDGDANIVDYDDYHQRDTNMNKMKPKPTLSYVRQKFLTLVCILAAKSDLLLLDEPVAGIAPEMIDKILGIIKDLPSKGKSVIIIEHNMDAIMEVCDRVIFMDMGKKISEGKPEEVRNDPRVIEAYID